MSNHTLRMRFKKLSQCRELWTNVFEETPEPSPFLSFEWFDCLCRLLLHDDPEVMLLYDHDTCVAVMPMTVKDCAVHFIADERVTDLGGFLYLRGYEDDIINAITSFITREKLHIDLFPLEQTNLLGQRLAQRTHGASFDQADVCPVLELPQSWDDYIAALTSKLRHELRRKLRKGSAIHLQTCKPAAIDTLFELMARDVQKRRFLTADMRAFFKAIAERFFNKGWLRFRIAFIRDVPVAALLAFSFQRHIYLYNMGIEPDYVALSPGIVAIGMDIKDAIAEGYTFYDFLRGDEEYKFRFGAQRQHTARLRA